MCLQYSRTSPAELQRSAKSCLNSTWNGLQLFANKCLPTVQELRVILFGAIEKDSEGEVHILGGGVIGPCEKENFTQTSV